MDKQRSRTTEEIAVKWKKPTSVTTIDIQDEFHYLSARISQGLFMILKHLGYTCSYAIT